MLEKIGLPPRPSVRGNTWVLDASHCQGCSSPFTFINRKHHCRRCGGIFCGTCTQNRMVLRGQGDSPVRICEPCKNLEEAARFELRHGHKSRISRGSSRSISKPEDEVLNQILGSDRKEFFSSGQDLNNSIATQSASSSSFSHHRENSSQDAEGKISRSISVGGPTHIGTELESASPEELRQQALEEKKKYKALKGKGKSQEALRAFKMGKELERKADALELYKRKSLKKSLHSRSTSDEHPDRDDSKESFRKKKLSSEAGKEKPDLSAELRELGWSDMDLHEEDKKSANLSLEGELSSLLGEVLQKTNKEKSGHGLDNSQVIALKKKALVLKREGKLAEAKEELKKAKILEKQLEEQEFLDGAEDSDDDELSALIHSMDNDKREDFLIPSKQELGFDFDRLLGASENLVADSNFDVTDDDMEDPEIAAALESLGWTEDSNPTQKINRESLESEITSLKREALGQKRAGNVSEAMSLLKKAKLLERDLENFVSQTTDSLSSDEHVSKLHGNDLGLASKSKLEIQKELLGVKKKALALRREGRLEEAEQELKKGKVLEHQLEQMGPTSEVKISHPSVVSRNLLEGEEVSEDVTDQDMHDPAYLSLLKNLGWNEEESDSKQTVTPSLQIHESSVTLAPKSRRSKSEMQRELLGLKRKALALRRQGETEAAEEMLQKAKVLEDEIAEIDQAPKRVVHTEYNSLHEKADENEEEADVTEKEMQDPAVLSVLNNLGWKDEVEPITEKVKNAKQQEDADPCGKPQIQSEIERELLNLKRKALALRKKGETDEAEGVLNMAKALKTQLEDLEASKQAVSGPLDVFQDRLSRDSEKQEQIRGALEIPLSENANMIDLLTGDNNWTSTIGTEEPNRSDYDTISKQNDIVVKEVSTVPDIVVEEASTVPETSHKIQSPIRQEILTRKKKAVALKREGKLAEALEELKHAKLLEKSLEEEEENPKPQVVSSRVSSVSSMDQKKDHSSSSTSAHKPVLSSRDRFKLQQESLSHKRQALKLRREGRIQEAESEFELAKALENQLEELTGQDADAVDDVSVEDFLDPQLLSALKAIGLDNHRESVKSDVGKSESFDSERIQLEERIKAEKVKAVTLKRSGKQVEAMDALRQAKLFEKKLTSLGSK